MTVVAVIVVWAAVAVTLTIVMGRRGHDPFMWGVLAAILGPLAIPLAIGMRTRPVALSVPARPGGALVGVDPEADPVVLAGLLADVPALGRSTGVTLVTVLAAEARDTPAGRDAVARAERHLLDVAAALAADGRVSPPFDRVVGFGDPAEELARLAAGGRFTIVVLGRPATSGHHLLRGSVRARLDKRTPVPLVLTATSAR